MRNNPCLHSPYLFLQAMDSFLFGRKHSQQKPLTTTTTCVRHRVSINFIALLALQHTFRFFRKKKYFKVKENLWTVNRKTEFPDFSLTLTISKIFPDLKKFSVFPDFSLTVATLFMFLLSAAICPWFSNQTLQLVLNLDFRSLSLLCTTPSGSVVDGFSLILHWSCSSFFFPFLDSWPRSTGNYPWFEVPLLPTKDFFSGAAECLSEMIPLCTNSLHFHLSP